MENIFYPKDDGLQKKMKLAMGETGISLIEISRRTGISKENIYKWSRGTKPADTMARMHLEKFLDELLDPSGISTSSQVLARLELMKEHGKEFVTQRQISYFITIPLRGEGESAVLLNAKAGSGTVIFEQNEPKLIASRMDAPFRGDILGMVPVFGKSMEPTFQSGSHVGIVRLKDIKSIEWGQYYYLFDTNFQGMIKRVYPGKDDNILELFSDNPDQRYPPITKEFSQIEAIFKIKVCLTDM